jgi:excisionase family DNA binding protein
VTVEESLRAALAAELAPIQVELAGLHAEMAVLRAAVDGLRQARPPGAWLTSDEAARHLGITRTALLKRVERGEVPAQRLGRRWRFRRRDLDALVGDVTR